MTSGRRCVLYFLLTVVLCAFTSCGSLPDARCEGPPDWFYNSLTVMGKPFYDSNAKRCRLWPAQSTCWEFCAGDEDSERCRECEENIDDWFPFDTIEECQEVCEVE